MIIGISAKAGCGKTTLSRMLLERVGGVVLSFAGVLKKECAEYFGFPVEWCYSEEGKAKLAYTTGQGLCDAVMDFANSHGKGALTVRQALQWYGTDFRRAQDPDYWLKAMDAEAARFPSGNILVDDVRFPNEAEWCRARGICIRLEPYGGYSAGEAGKHISETALDGWDGFDLVYSPPFGGLAQVADHVAERVRAMLAEWPELSTRRGNEAAQFERA